MHGWKVRLVCVIAGSILVVWSAVALAEGWAVTGVTENADGTWTATLATGNSSQEVVHVTRDSKRHAKRAGAEVAESLNNGEVEGCMDPCVLDPGCGRGSTEFRLAYDVSISDAWTWTVYENDEGTYTADVYNSDFEAGVLFIRSTLEEASALGQSVSEDFQAGVCAAY